MQTSGTRLFAFERQGLSIDQRILVPFDGSDASEIALERALAENPDGDNGSQRPRLGGAGLRRGSGERC